MATILEIEERLDVGFSVAASLGHFAFHSSGQINSDIVIEESTISPYCLDHESRQMIFADIPADINLASVPFVYRAQHDNALRLIAVSYDELPNLVKNIKLPEKMIFVFSTGRAGSTLMNQIFNEIDGVTSFSEPDVFLNLVHIAPHTSNHKELQNLMTVCIKLLSQHYADNIVAIKHRGECIDITDLFYEAFPNAKNLFMYRHIMDWTASWRRIALEWDALDDVPVEQLYALHKGLVGRTDYIDPFIPDNVQSIKISVSLALLWMFYINAYLEASEQSIPFLALRYRDLNEHRRQVLEKVFEYVGIPISKVEQAIHGFERDSQAGTGLQRSEKGGNTQMLDDENRKLVFDTLAKHPRQFHPDMILPATLML